MYSNASQDLLLDQPVKSTNLVADHGADSAANSHLGLTKPIKSGTIVVENDTKGMMQTQAPKIKAKSKCPFGFTSEAESSSDELSA